MNQLIIKLFAILAMVVFSNVSIAKPLKPQVTVLHSSSKSSSDEAISYPKGTPKLTIAQVIFPVGGILPKHTHPAPLIVHIMSGEVTSERPNGKKVVYKAGDTFVEAANSPHTVTNTAKTPTIVYAVIAGAEGIGPLTVFAK
jgi:quercetin dioxygenase-like cupin family protein